MLKKPSNISSRPGVYAFRRGTTPLYVGKAANLKKRLAAYFQKNTSKKIELLLQEADSLDWTETPSEIEALIKESELIKKHIPKYNILMRDDKSYFYLGRTREKFPRLFVAHKPRLRSEAKYNQPDFIGPFTGGFALKETVRMLRSVFPFCVCKEIHKHPCLNFEMGRCPGYCCFPRGNAQANEKEYRNGINRVAGILSGRGKKILRELYKNMKSAAKSLEFERAAEIRGQIWRLENIFRHAVFHEAPVRRQFNWERIQRNLEVLFGLKIKRAEGYDISNISGSDATGSMVVFVDGKPANSAYRMFGIKTIRGQNDIAMHKEVIERRLNHPEWKIPELMIIDGGRAQLNAAGGALSKKGFLNITVVALAKREEELYIKGRLNPIRLDSLPPETAFFFQRVRDESHRFAKKYHRKRREISYRPK